MKDKLFVYPTDTVWGIGGSIFSKQCYEKIAKIKGRDENKPLSVLFPNVEELCKFVSFPDEYSVEWLEKFFSLESTLGVPVEWVKAEIPDWVCQGSPFMAVRCISSNAIREIYEMINDPITSTSLNYSGYSPIVNGFDAREFFEDHIADEVFIENRDAPCSGRASTIVLLKEEAPEIVREGLYSKEICEHLELLST
ncbi:L-threonylcarbamoyladenylate synthase [Halobacteriovorax sp. HLS]|uniref:L-threonylcarbamoyladenylate synthase n=1 Tax=Halobacteriovorax sp. HLS TaxID=2234000 RepID=UPI0013E381DD|nr:Sua5/YciO/YrdC/YwlC family protein [Halobacteriovorax sp. HLS]